VFWLSRPPYIRWALAGLVVLVGLLVEFRPAQTVAHPFAAETIGVGETVDESRVIWRDVPVDLLAPVMLPATATRRIEPGEPVLGGAPAGDPGAIPAGWWAIELGVPAGATTGMAVKLVSDTGATDGLVIETRDGDFGERTGLVAVPGDSAQLVARASLDGSVAVLLGG
jgi:hypothetical protein